VPVRRPPRLRREWLGLARLTCAALGLRQALGRRIELDGARVAVDDHGCAVAERVDP
jgi:hypothetical protein